MIQVLVWTLLKKAHLDRDYAEACFCYTVECLDNVEHPERLWETFVDNQREISILLDEIRFGTTLENRGRLWNQIVLNGEHANIRLARSWFDVLMQSYAMSVYNIMSKWMKEIGFSTDYRRHFYSYIRGFIEAAAECRDWLYCAEKIAEIPPADIAGKVKVFH